MCFMKTPDVPEPTPIQEPPQQQDTNVQKARNDSQQRLRAVAGSQSTILSAGGAAPASGMTQGKTLLGQ